MSNVNLSLFAAEILTLCVLTFLVGIAVGAYLQSKAKNDR